MGMNADSGEYIPSYFFVMLDTNEKLNAANLLDSPTFFHEYIHFLQDIFLPYCARMNLLETGYLRLIEDVAQDRGLTIPFDSWDEDSIITRSQNKSTWGDVKFIDNETEIRNIKSEFFVIPSGPRVFKYTAELESGEEYQVGARDFLEYIAHVLEYKFYEGMDAPNYPYRTVDFLFNFYGWNSVPVECRIAVAEFVLHNDNPMNLFTLIVRYVNDNSCLDIFYSYEKTSYFLNNFMWNSAGGFSETAISKTVRRLVGLKDTLGERFVSDDNSAIRFWLMDVIEYVSDMINNRFQFSELYRDTKSDALKKINSHINGIGIPLVFNKKMEFISLVPGEMASNEFLNLYFSFLFMKFVRVEQRACPACRFCIANNEDIFDDSCKNAPLSRWRTDLECPMGALFDSHNFNII